MAQPMISGMSQLKRGSVVPILYSMPLWYRATVTCIKGEEVTIDFSNYQFGDKFASSSVVTKNDIKDSLLLFDDPVERYKHFIAPLALNTYAKSPLRNRRPEVDNASQGSDSDDSTSRTSAEEVEADSSEDFSNDNIPLTSLAKQLDKADKKRKSLRASVQNPKRVRK